MTSQADIGQALSLSSINHLRSQERIATELFFGPLSDQSPAAASPPPEPPPHDQIKRRSRLLKVDEQNAKEEAIKAATTNIPFPENRPSCNRNGEIITPSQRCTANKKDGTQCKSRTCNGQFCYTHTIREFGFAIKKSKIEGAGRGLIAMRDIPQGTTLTPYTGHLSSDPDVDHGGSHYVIGLSRNTTIDAAPRNTAPGRLINDPHETNLNPNCIWVIDNIRRKVRIVTTRLIPKGEELLISYGPGYWARTREIERERVAKLSVKQKAKESAAKLAKLKLKAAAEKAVSLIINELHLLTPQAPQFTDPKSYEEAMNSRFWPQWQEAMKKEQESLINNLVYTITDYNPGDVRTLGTKWVFKIKLDINNEIERFKARLVVLGYGQWEGTDYDLTYSGVLAKTTLRVLLCWANQLSYKAKSMDVETAFLNAPLHEDIYITTPPGFVGKEQGRVLKLNRALYGLKQAGREWNLHLVRTLEGIGYKSCKYTDHCVMIKMSKSKHIMIIAMFVDDLPHFYHQTDEAEMNADKALLQTKFKIKELGDLSLILGVRVSRDIAAGTLSINQQQFITKLLDEYGYAECKSEPTPQSTNILPPSGAMKQENRETSNNPELTEKRKKISVKNFPSIIGSLQYLANYTRPDIANAVNYGAKATADPQPEHITVVKRILRYLHGTRELGITYTRSTDSHITMTAFTDADWAGDTDSRKSTSGVAIKMCGAVVDWVSKRQSCVAQSTSEAEYLAANEAAMHIVSERRRLNELGFPQSSPTILYCDNQTTMRMITDEGKYERRKHIDVKHHYIREQIERNTLSISYVESALNQADLLTKPLPKASFIFHRNALMGQPTQSDNIKS